MLSMDAFREEPDRIRESEERRGKDPAKVDEVVELDREWRETRQELDDLRAERNTVSDEIAGIKADGGDASDEIERMQDVKAKIQELEEEEAALLEERDEARYAVGNIMHESVPDGADEDDNVEVRTWEPESGKVEDAELGADVMEANDLIETGKAVEVAGDRAYYLRGDLVRLNLALVQYGIDKLVENGFVPVQTPYMLEEEPMAAAAELEDFHDQLYKLDREDRYLIATSEQPLAATQYDELIAADDLPIRLGGFSTNFRREAGKHGTQTRGTWRVHQFEKIEQFIFSEPADSWDLHEELLANAEDVMQELDLPYRVVDVCAGDLGDTPAKKYDIEVWRPPLQAYGEVVSCSNCTDYQARKLNARVRRPGEDNEMVHTLNATLLATSRIMTAIVENNQADDGSIRIPEPLRPYMGGQDRIP